MKNENARIKMSRYTTIMIIFLILAMCAIGPSLYLPDYWSFLPPAILWLIAMYNAVRIDQIKKRHRNLGTVFSIILVTIIAALIAIISVWVFRY